MSIMTAAVSVILSRRPSLLARRALTVLVVTLVLAGSHRPVLAQPASGARAPIDEAALTQRISALERELRSLREALASIDTSRGAEPVAAIGSSSAEGTDGAPPRRSVEDRLDEIDQRIRILARQHELERERAAEAAKHATFVDAGRGGFGLRSADGAFNFRLRGIVQADGRFYLDDDAALGASTFVARRVRPIFQATAFKQFDFRVVPDFGDGRTVLQDAHVDVRFTPALRVRAGKFKSPFGLERLASAGELLFVERAAPTLVAPNRDLGLMLYGDVLHDTASFALGVFNGVPDGGSADIDDGDGKDGAARLFVHPFKGSGNAAIAGLGAGVAATYGVARGTVATPGLASYRTTGALTFFRYRSDGTAAGTAFADGDRARVSGQGYYYAGSFGLLTEQTYSRQRVRRGTAAAIVGVNAWQLATSWVLTGERASYRGVTPRRSVDPARGQWGALEVAARYTGLRVDDDAFPVFADPAASAAAARAWTIGLNWFLSPVMKLVLDYEQTRFDGGARGGDRPTGHDLFTRLQLAF